MANDEVVKGPIKQETLIHAAQLIGLELSTEEQEMMLDGLNERLEQFEALREITLDNSVAPALDFNPALSHSRATEIESSCMPSGLGEISRPEQNTDLAFMPLTHLAKLIETQQITSVELTNLYLQRLRQYDPHLKCVVNHTEELALEQAKRADEEIAKGEYRGPLHGIPWGAKDLLAVKNYPTTWGAEPYENQKLDYNATVVERLSQAGAVLVAKLTTGALAYGDVWHGGTTKSPWDLEEGSSGSSAGPASATSGGLVGFSIGSETLGSIVSPSHRCGTTGLRPTFGRVSKFGAMALSWSMDKLGPICRSVEDCALVFHAIHGSDPQERTAIDAPFHWRADSDVKKLRIGYVKSAFDEARETKAYDDASLEVLKSLGVDLIPIELPDLPYAALRMILVAEAAAAFDELTRQNLDDQLTRQDKDAWPNIFRSARFIPAVEYIQANRVRTLAIQAMDELMEKIDVYVCPSYGADNLTLTNLTGHPSVVIPNGFSEKNTPISSITFMGNLYRETDVMLVAKAVQDATDFHKKQPEMIYDA